MTRPSTKINPPEREENVGFTEEEEISWRQYFTDFKTTVWPMLAAQGFTFPEALTFWRHEILLCQITELLQQERE